MKTNGNFLSATMLGWACALGVCVLAVGCGGRESVDYSGPTADWPHYGADAGGTSYSPLTQLTAANVDSLQLAWEYRHGDVSDGSGEWARSSFQVTPLVAEGTLYFCTPFNRVIALDAETGVEKWAFDPELRFRRGQGPYPLTCRGVAWWQDGKEGRDGGTRLCSRRIFTGTRDSELIALDADTGRPCPGFGDAGRVYLREGLSEHEQWEYYPTSAPVAVADLVIVGALVADNERVDAPSGVVRAFDARDGSLRWAWDPVPPAWHRAAGDNGGRWQSGSPNVWAPLSVDEENGLVYVPTGNPSPDLYGGQRRGLDYYGSSVVALDLDSGEPAWHFQTVHHDVWDYDVPAQPTLFDIAGVGGGRPGLVQATKMGHLFLLDRLTGEPLYPVEELAVATDGVPGELLSATQPFPTHPAPLQARRLDASDAFGFSPWDRADCREKITSLRNDGVFTPPQLTPTLQWPGSAGGANWGGVSVDPVRGRLYVNQLRTPMVIQLIEREKFDELDRGSVVYPDELYPMQGTPYGAKRGPLLSSAGAPCNPPPWGTMTAVDLVSGEVLWESVLGTTRDIAPWPMWLPLGTPNLGGSVVTAGGLVFIGATTDKFFRAFDVEDGREVWTRRIPYTANSSPVTYRLGADSRQFVVIAAGGHGWSEPGDALLAFALPAAGRGD